MSTRKTLLSAVVVAILAVAQASGDQVVLKQGTDYIPGHTYYGTTDTWIDYSNPTTNYGTSDYMYANMYGSNYQARKRGLVKFDLTGIIPTNAQISSATLSMYLWGLDNMQSNDYIRVGAYQVGEYRPWAESQATWNIFSGSSYWSTAGAENVPWDREANYRSTRDFNHDSVTGIYYDWDVTSSVQGYYGGTIGNTGWLFRAWDFDRTADCGIILGTQNATLGARPVLTINYTVLPEPLSAFFLVIGLGALAVRRGRSCGTGR